MIHVAPCGCTFEGRSYNTRGCSEVGTESGRWLTITGRQTMQHAMRALKKMETTR